MKLIIPSANDIVIMYMILLFQYNTSFRQIIDQLDNFRKQSIGGAKEGRKKFEKETQKFYQSQDRYLSLSTKKDEQILQEVTHP